MPASRACPRSVVPLGLGLCLVPVLGLSFLSLFSLPRLDAAEPTVSAPLRVAIVSGSAEYHSDRTLAAVQKVLEGRYRLKCSMIAAKGFEELPGLEVLEDCDTALFFTRRLTISGESLERVKRYLDGGHPFVALRTASHGFQNWLEFDRRVLGATYGGHCGPGNMPGRPTMEAQVLEAAKAHPILEGVGNIRSRSTLYRYGDMASDVEVLMMGSSPACPEPQPFLWTRVHAGARLVYTTFGQEDDFESSAFQRLLANALFWSAGRKTERVEPAPLPPLTPASEGAAKLRVRTRTEDPKGSETWREAAEDLELPFGATAFLLCDVWNEHWCRGATVRCDALAPKIDLVAKALRAKGVRVIHAPSETLDFYADRWERRRIAEAPRVALPPPIERTDPPLPIDDSGGGCDTGEKPWYKAWTRQHAAIEIGAEDLISDDGDEIRSFLAANGIRNLIVAGVHTNMCVLGRSFGIRAMTRGGIRCVLVRDLTDAMYDPADRPKVSHDRGTELVVEHIERYWCPSTTSGDLFEAFR